jgi:hypothetical protein
MKKIYLIIGILSTLNSNAQIVIPAAGSYTPNPNLNKFVGTWLWFSGTDTMKLVFQKQIVHHPSPSNYDLDGLLGWHRFVKNGIELENNLSLIGTPYWNGNFSFSDIATTSNSVRFSFDDLTKHKNNDGLYFTMLNNSTTQAKWEFKNSNGIMFPSAPYSYGFTTPSLMIFIKQ